MMSSIGHLFGCDSAKEEWRLKGLCSALAPAAVEMESPPARPPERPAGPRPQKRPASAAATLGGAQAAKPAIPAVQPAEFQEVPSASRRKVVRSIDRQDPFAD